MTHRDPSSPTPMPSRLFNLLRILRLGCRLGQRRATAIKNRVWVQTRLFEGLFPVHGDRVQLQQVVLNLLLNAVEAMGSVEGAPRDLFISTCSSTGLRR